ncbi:MAG: DUF1934 family protein [Bacilli bacterium]|nr:DUF1934 family protein [Bacilli bacterium]
MKIKIHEKIISSNSNDFEINTTGLLNENTLKFMEDDTKVIINFNDKSVNIKKENSDKIIVLDLTLKQSSGYYILKQENFKINLDIKTNHISCSDKQIKIDYDLKINKENMGNFKIFINMCNN